MPYFALIIMFYHVKIACYHYGHFNFEVKNWKRMAGFFGSAATLARAPTAFWDPLGWSSQEVPPRKVGSTLMGPCGPIFECEAGSNRAIWTGLVKPGHIEEA